MFLKQLKQWLKLYRHQQHIQCHPYSKSDSDQTDHELKAKFHALKTISLKTTNFNTIGLDNTNLNNINSSHIEQPSLTTQDMKTASRNIHWELLRAALRGQYDAAYQLGLYYLNHQPYTTCDARKWLEYAAAH